MVAVVFAALLMQGPKEAQALLDESAAKLKATQSVTLTLDAGPIPGAGMRLKIKLLRGGFLAAEGEEFSAYMTPWEGYSLLNRIRTYSKITRQNLDAMVGQPVPGFEPFFSKAKPLLATGAASPDKLGDRSVLKIPVLANPRSQAILLYLDPDTKLPAGYAFGAGELQNSVRYSDVKLDAGLTAKDFEWTPTTGWRPAPGDREEPAMTDEPPPPLPDFTKNLLKLGSKAPSFTLATPRGSATSLAAVLKGKRAVLVNFWFYG